MKVVKITHKALRPNDDGHWIVWAVVYINGQRRSCSLMFDTFEESDAVRVGQVLDIEEVRISSKPRIK